MRNSLYYVFVFKWKLWVEVVRRNKKRKFLERFRSTLEKYENRLELDPREKGTVFTVVLLQFIVF